MKKSLLAAALITAAFSASASANWNVSAGASHMSMDGIDVSFNLANVSVAKQFDLGDSQFNLMPELRIGTGIGDDQLMGADVEIDRFTTIGLRGGYQVNDNVNLFVQPSYGEIKVTASAGGMSASEESDWEFGIGLGVNYAFSSNSSVEVAYEQFDDTDVIGAAYRYTF